MNDLTLKEAPVSFNYTHAKYKIVKSNKLIGCRSNFTTLEQRILLLAIVQIKKDDSCSQMYKVLISEALGRTNGANYDTVRKAVENLHKSIIQVWEGKKWKNYSLVTESQGEVGKNFVEVRFHEDVQDFLFNLKGNFTKYMLKNVIKFKRSYSYRIYEICKMYEFKGEQNIKITNLKEMLTLEKRYEDTNNFLKRVIFPAIKEINQFSDLSVVFSIAKVGRAIDSLDFSVTRKPPVKNRLYAPGEAELWDKAEKQYKELGYTDDEFYDIETQYDVYTTVAVLMYYEETVLKKRQHGETIKYPKQWIRAIFAKALKDERIKGLAYNLKNLPPVKPLPEVAKKEKISSDSRKKMYEIGNEIVTLKHQINYLKSQGTLPDNLKESLGASTLNEAISKIELQLAEKKKEYEVFADIFDKNSKFEL